MNLQQMSGCHSSLEEKEKQKGIESILFEQGSI
jgi:hypothetical protein